MDTGECHFSSVAHIVFAITVSSHSGLKWETPVTVNVLDYLLM